MEASDDNSLHRVGLAFFIILLFSLSLGTSIFLITKTSSSQKDDSQINTATPSPSDLFLGAPGTFPDGQVKLPTTPTPDTNNIDSPSFNSPTPSPSGFTTFGDEEIMGPNFSLP